jgi:hypothetical protein
LRAYLRSVAAFFVVGVDHELSNRRESPVSLEETAITTLGVGGAALLLLWSLMREQRAARKGEDSPMSWEDTAITSAITLGVEVVKKFFDSKKDDRDLISVGLAVGYFYNFLDVFYENIEHTSAIELFDKPGDKDGNKYDTETIEVQVILPKRLDVDTYDRCVKDFNATKKGSIFLHKQKRFYGINYIIVQRGDKTGLIVLDLARPLMAVKPFYEDILKYETNNMTDIKWLKAQSSEISAFKETLERLRARRYGTLPGRLHFRELG